MSSLRNSLLLFSLSQRGCTRYVDDENRNHPWRPESCLANLPRGVYICRTRHQTVRQLGGPSSHCVQNQWRLRFEKRGSEVWSCSLAVALFQETAKSHQVPLGHTEWALQDHGASWNSTEHCKGRFRTTTQRNANLASTCHCEMCSVAALALWRLAPVHATVGGVGVWDVEGRVRRDPLDVERVSLGSWDVSPHGPAAGVGWHCALQRDLVVQKELSSVGDDTQRSWKIQQTESCQLLTSGTTETWQPLWRLCQDAGGLSRSLVI